MSARAVTSHPMDITDAWKNSYSENTTQQGVGRQVHGAPSQPGGAGAFQLQVRPRRAHLHRGRGNRRPSPARRTSRFKDIDENKPTGSIRIRVETICYFLKRYREDMVARKKKQSEIDIKLAEFEARMRAEFAAGATLSGNNDQPAEMLETVP